MPYADKDDKAVVTRLVRASNGNLREDEAVLASPPACPPRLATLIQQCLTVNREVRPTFGALAQRTLPQVWLVSIYIALKNSSKLPL